MLGNAGEVFLVCLVALEGFLFKRPSVVGDVFLKLLKLGLETGSLGNENVVNKVVGIEDFSFSVLDFLVETSDFAVVDISSAAVACMDLVEFSVEVANELFDVPGELSEDAVGLEVKLSEVENEISPLRLLDLSKHSLLM